jgi:peroxiredoxin (alkyl hydroperoxide reductase subunit C)
MLVFYPVDFSPVCSDQLSIYQEVLPEITAKGAELVGVTVDSSWAHKAFQEKLGIDLPLLADFHPKGEVCRAYGAYIEERGHPNRSLVLIDEEGVVRWVHESPTPLEIPGANLIFDALAAVEPDRPERNVEMMRRGLSAFSRGAFDEAAAEIHPDIEWHVAFRLPDLPEGRDVCHGLEEVRELWEAFAAAWEELTVEVEEMLYVDDKRLVARARFRGRGAKSRVEVDRVLYYSYRFRDDGRLVYTRAFDDEETARRDAGVAEESATR